MINVLAKFDVMKTTFYSVGVLAFCIWFFSIPLTSELPFFQWLQSDRFTRFWPIGAPGAAGGILISTVLLARLIFANASALYQNGDHIILMAPFLWRVRIGDIQYIDKFLSNRPTGPIRKIRLQLHDGREKYIGMALLADDSDVLIGKLRDLTGIRPEVG